MNIRCNSSRKRGRTNERGRLCFSFPTLNGKASTIGADAEVRGIATFLMNANLTSMLMNQWYVVHHALCVLFSFSFRRGKPTWKEIARNKSKLVERLLSDYDKRIRPYTGGIYFNHL